MSSQQRYNEERRRERRIVEELKRNNPPLAPKVTMSTTVDMNRSSSGIGGLLDGLKAKIDILDQGSWVFTSPTLPPALVSNLCVHHRNQSG